MARESKPSVYLQKVDITKLSVNFEREDDWSHLEKFSCDIKRDPASFCLGSKKENSNKKETNRKKVVLDTFT